MRTSTAPHPPQPRPDILFAEDFDAPPGVTVLDDAADAPEEEPTFTEETLAAARADAYAEGHRNGLAKAAADRAEVTLQMLGAIAERLQGGRAEAARVAEESAEALARLLLGTLAGMMPALCARHGAGEVAALARAVLPALAREPRVTIRVSPHVAEAVERELQHLDPDLRERVALLPTDAVPPGDARIAWSDGATGRDAAALWRDVAKALAPLDLLPADLAPPFEAMAA
jgi:flagellar assembly protein FliH